MPRGVHWWIPVTGLVASATLLTGGFAWSVGNATRASAEDALAAAGIDSVEVDNSYRDVTLYGPADAEDAAVDAVTGARLVQDVEYVAGAGPAGPDATASPSASSEPTATAEPSPAPSATGEPTPACRAITPECMGGTAYLAAVLTVDDSVYFAFDAATLDKAAKRKLDIVAAKVLAALEYDDGVHIVIAGHSDSSGDARYNRRLSKVRAEHVRDYLLAQGVPASVLAVVGRGEAHFLGSNKTADGRAKNRRVDFEVKVTEASS